MSRANQGFRPVVLVSPYLWVSVAVGLLLVILAAVGVPALPLALIGAGLSVLAGLIFGYLRQEGDRKQSDTEATERLMVPLALASDPDLFRFFQSLRDSLTELARHTDETLRAVALQKLAAINTQIEGLRAGTIVFAGTEPWRAAYDALLASPRLREYWAVAWVRTSDYWQDAPGRQSMNANFEAAHRGVLVERYIILPESLWPTGELFPTEAIRPWIEKQHNNGFRVFLVRERDLAAQPDLLADFGLYDERLVATQEIDTHSRTIRFTLDINPAAIRLALDRWRRLSVHGISYRVILDRSERAG
jgi:hypothetical protein